MNNKITYLLAMTFISGSFLSQHLKLMKQKMQSSQVIPILLSRKSTESAKRSKIKLRNLKKIYQANSQKSADLLS